MKQLLLMRHAKSSWDDTSLSDFDRPLNERGKTNAPEMGKRLLKRVGTPDLIISSPAKRALSTAKRVAKVLAYPREAIQEQIAIYEASPNDIMRLIRQIDHQYTTVLMIGHNPTFTYMLSFLSNSTIDNLPTSGVMKINFRTEQWAHITPNSGLLDFYDYPKNPA